MEKASLAKVFLVLVLFFFILPSKEYKVSAAYSFDGKVTASILNVRSKPAVSSKALGKLKKNQVITVIDQQKGWYKIKSGKTLGWVSSTYVTGITWNGYATASNLNVRKSPNLKSNVLIKIPKNTAVTIEGKDGSWLKVFVPGKKVRGWVSASYVSKKKPAAPAKTLGTYYVTADILNVRVKASASSKIAAKISKGEAVQVNSQSGNWSNITTVKGTKGWVSSLYINKKKPLDNKGNSTNKETKIILKDNSNIRTGPGTHFSVITLEKAGTSLVKIGEKNGWVQVKTSKSKTGWVAGWLVSSPGSGLKGKVIVIDAGHGGYDNGASGKIYKEKSLNLQSAQELRSLLQNAGAKVIMTRSSDKYFSLSQRVSVSHSAKADAFISIHYNSFTASSSGVVSFYYSSSKDRELAQSLHKGLVSQTKMRDMGARYGDYHVLRNNKQPSVLLELGFLSNPKEEKHIGTKEYQKKAAKGIYEGLLDYFNS